MPEDLLDGRPFELVEAKLEEAGFFLELLAAAGSDVFAFRCYFSAFVSAARSVTFVLQFVMHGVDGFDEWWGERQDEMRLDPLLRFFVERRNETLKTGETRITGGMFHIGDDGQPVVRHFFGGYGPLDPFTPVVDDVESAAREYLDLLATLVRDCRGRFAAAIEGPFDLEALAATGWTVDELEERLGWPPGWSSPST